MRVLGALVRVVGIASFATFGWGCQVLGGVDGDLVLSVAGAGGPVGVEGDPLTWEASGPGTGDPPVYELPSEWFSVYNPTGDLTSQHEGKLVVGYPPHSARPRNVGKKWGLAAEKARQNHVLNSAWDGAEWIGGQPVPMSVTSGQEDPVDDAVAQGVRFSSDGGQQSNSTTVGAGTIASTWARGVTGTSPYAYLAFGANWVEVDDANWKRYVVPLVGDDTRNLRLETQTFPGGPAPITAATAVIAYGAQVEDGTYPSSLIPTYGQSRAREADTLVLDGYAVAKNGWFSVTIRFAPHYGSNELPSLAHDIIYLYKGQILVRLQRGMDTQTAKLVLHVPGEDAGVKDLVVDGLTWQREDTLTVVAWSAPDGRFLSIEGATSGNGEASSPVPAKPLVDDTLGETSMALGDKNGSQESADLQYIQFR
jgi:hypothetical protein